jgi:hypothetical protein
VGLKTREMTGKEKQKGIYDIENRKKEIREQRN